MYRSAVAVFILTVNSSTVSAAPIGALDPSTNLEWLSVRATEGMTFNEVSSQLGAGGSFAGYRYATRSELQTFTGDFGIPLGMSNSLAAFNAARTLLSGDWGYNTVLEAGPYNIIASVVITADSIAPGTHELASVEAALDLFDPVNSFSNVTLSVVDALPDNSSYITVGGAASSALVRAVPEPSGIVNVAGVCCAGLVRLVWYRYRKLREPDESAPIVDQAATAGTYRIHVRGGGTTGEYVLETAIDAAPPTVTIVLIGPDAQVSPVRQLQMGGIRRGNRNFSTARTELPKRASSARRRILETQPTTINHPAFTQLRWPAPHLRVFERYFLGRFRG
jgi:hypothetical protein